MLFLFYYLAPLLNDYCDITMRAVHFWGEIEFYLLDKSALPVIEKERMRKGKICAVRDRHLARRQSNKKQKHTTNWFDKLEFFFSFFP